MGIEGRCCARRTARGPASRPRRAAEAGVKTSRSRLMMPPGASSVYPPRITVLPSASSTCPGYQRPAFIRGCSVHALVQGLKVKTRLSPPKLVYASFGVLLRPDEVAAGDQDLAAGEQRLPGAEEGRRVRPLGAGPVRVDAGRRDLGERIASVALGRVPERPHCRGCWARSGTTVPQNITSPVGSMAALMAAWGISKGARVQRPTSLARPGALGGLRELFGLAAVLRRDLAPFARRQPLHWRASAAWAARWRACSAACWEPSSRGLRGADLRHGGVPSSSRRVVRPRAGRDRQQEHAQQRREPMDTP